MNRFLLFSLFASLFVAVHAQSDLPERSYVNSDLAPFYHGVASGDATSDKVIIWTRITNEATSSNVIWRIATDSFFNNIVDQGVFTTDVSRDFTVKVDVQDLEPDTWYFYEFEDENGSLSQRGRTKTLPVNDISNFRAALVSCSSYPHGFFNAYDRLSEKNDFNAVIHLGDYIYEYALNEYGKHPQRKVEPENAIVTLSDYRTRYSLYRLDTMLQKLHQQYPFYNIWDDHEFANNTWRDGAENHNPSRQGDWNSRKSAALQAYLEWIPIREIDPDNKFRIYRNVKVGDLAEIFFLDTRIIGRELETDPDGPNKRLLGEMQMDWLQQGLKNSTSQWKVIAQQVMVAPLLAFGLTLNTDQWDGYTFERKRLFDFINNNDIDNVVVLTGDIHTAWANDLPFGKTKYNGRTGEGSAGVEFVTTSVSSPGLPFSINPAILNALNPHIKDCQLDQKGYIMLDLNKERAQGDFFFTRTTNKPDTNLRYKNSWYTLDKENRLKRTRVVSVPEIPNIEFAPRDLRDKTVTPVKNHTIGTVIGAYPNPFISTVGLQYYLPEAKSVSIQLFDMAGRLIYEKPLGLRQVGLYYDSIETGQLPTGQYRLNITDGKNQIGRNIIKIQ